MPIPPSDPFALYDHTVSHGKKTKTPNNRTVQVRLAMKCFL